MAHLTRRVHVLEVERKFCGLAVPALTQHAGVPPFRSLLPLPAKTIHDIYYDDINGTLAAAGTWVRLRNGVWEAKVKQGGTFQNSRFEELNGARAVAAHLRRITGRDVSEQALNSGQRASLQAFADMVTRRQAWQADGDFSIVLDTMDFGHQVGEVELQRTLELDEGEDAQQHKDRAVQQMDQQIVDFMNKYAWAFTSGEPKGKLTAFFELVGKSKT